MTEKEFRKRLVENKYFKDYHEHTMYRLPAVQYFMTAYTNNLVTSLRNNQRIQISSKLVTILEPIDDVNRKLINKAFQSIQFRVDEQRK